MLLTKLTTIELPAIKKFSGKEFEKLPNVLLSSNFKEHFVPKVEAEISKENIRVSELEKNATDTTIRAELGANHEITLGHFYQLLKEADKNKYYISYIADVDSKVWAVRAVWYDDGWDVEALPVANPLAWDAVYQVVSHDSSSQPLEASYPQVLSPFDSSDFARLEKKIDTLMKHLGCNQGKE